MSEADPAPEKPVTETIDAFHRGRFHVVQPKGIGHRSGMDAMLLAALVDGEGPTRVADLGAGAGAAGLAVAACNEKAEVLLVERSPLMAGFARKSIALAANAAFSARVGVLEADVGLAGTARVAAGLADEAFDQVIMNPPFNDRIGSRTPDALKAEAHAMEQNLFERWIRTAGAILKPGGQLSLIARPESIADIVAACGRRFGGIEITALHPRPGEPALRILVTAIKGSRARLTLRMPFVMHEPGRHAFTPFIDDLNNGRTSYPRLSKP
ncbi:methyltransferase [Shinella sp. 838]|uniref:tRNA1(Val) (adenine(37)-N6)-methyltransferase n=1 Tax=unclassified Shinella TaxID=2643062 RepID=UPI0003C5645A|nr:MULTISPECIES: methyltransferase [unclassified Shinella]EYR83411.1 methyltransferase small [Shinella sp. DD12]MCA0338569.1 methyltransferase [Pseudomonadota bacterium]MDG4671092.1 methyltransferase [Shinella sp. 838]